MSFVFHFKLEPRKLKALLLWGKLSSKFHVMFLHEKQVELYKWDEIVVELGVNLVQTAADL